MGNALNKILFILVLITMLIIPQYVIAKTFEITFHWKHSGTGMDKFVFISSPINVGPWIGSPNPVMIKDLTPTVVEEENRWKTTITVEAETFDDIQWWVVYAETSYGKKSATSEPAQAVLTPDQPRSLRKMNVVVPNKVLVTFI